MSNETKDEITNVKSEITNVKFEIANLKADMVNFKTDIIKWMFIFWISQVAVTFGLLLLFLKK